MDRVSETQLQVGENSNSCMSTQDNYKCQSRFWHFLAMQIAVLKAREKTELTRVLIGVNLNIILVLSV